MENEVWKEYEGEIIPFRGIIKVSNLGRIYKIAGNTSSRSRILSGNKENNGYIRLHVSINGVTYREYVHRLVAETFCDNPYKKPYVDHINAIRDDNRASNLHWVTPSENNNNPIYRNKRKKIGHEKLVNSNIMAEANQKKCKAENGDGRVILFNSISDLQKFFCTKANISRKIKSGDFFTSKKSKLYGWKVSLL